jgi:hypothetical protein
MHEQIHATPDIVESTDEDTNSPVVNPEDSAADPLVETPILLIPVVDPLEEKLVQNVRLDEPIPDSPLDEAITHQAQDGINTILSVALLDREEADRLRERWTEIQGKFVDEPRTAVQNADALVSDVIEKITEMFTSEHNALEGQWKQGQDVSTEDLRKALQRYRSFFNRLVA